MGKTHNILTNRIAYLKIYQYACGIKNQIVISCTICSQNVMALWVRRELAILGCHDVSTEIEGIVLILSLGICLHVLA